MVDFLKLVGRKTLLSDVLYYALNIGLVVVLFIVSQTIQSPVLAIGLVLMSKWRVLAVRPRYWWANIQANAVDIIVGLSIVSLMYLPDASLVFQAGLSVLYAIWLVVLKPLSKRHHMLLQAITAVAFGVTALFAVSYEWPVALVVLGMAVIGYSVARHFLYSHEEDQIVLLSGIWGLLFAELGWLAYHWTFAYTLPFFTSLKIPQVTLIALLVSFVGERLYRSWEKHGQIVVGEIILPVVFSVMIIGVMTMFFNSVTI